MKHQKKKSKCGNTKQLRDYLKPLSLKHLCRPRQQEVQLQAALQQELEDFKAHFFKGLSVHRWPTRDSLQVSIPVILITRKTPKITPRSNLHCLKIETPGNYLCRDFHPDLGCSGWSFQARQLRVRSRSSSQCLTA